MLYPGLGDHGHGAWLQSSRRRHPRSPRSPSTQALRRHHGSLPFHRFLVDRAAADAREAVLKVEGLRTEFRTGSGSVVAIDDLSYEVRAGETLAIVGESGSGKSVSSLSIMGLLPDPPGKVTGGHAWFDGKDLLKLDERGMQKLRGNSISMIFQEPMTSLNPVLSVGRQMTEGIIEHLGDLARRGVVARCRDAEAGPHPGARGAHARVPAPAFGRHAPAHHDRHGARLRAEAALRRRADNRSRRDDPGADPRHHARTARRDRHGDRPDHPRHGRRRRDGRPRGHSLCRTQGRGGTGRRHLRTPPASLHGRPARGAARPRQVRPGRKPDAERDSGHRSGARQPAERAAISPTLPACHRSMPSGIPAFGGKAGRAMGGLLASASRPLSEQGRRADERFRRRTAPQGREI